MKRRFIYFFIATVVTAMSVTSCQSFFDTDTNLITYTDDDYINSPSDTMYSVIGIIKQMQKIADKTVILGEIRGDLVNLTPYANVQLQQLANFTAGTDNIYNKPEDYYAVINNCNYFLSKADTSLTVRKYKVFEKEYAVVKAFRAWTYLQLAQIYGEVPFFIEPILSDKEASKDFPKKNIKELSEYFINDLIPYINTSYPSYGNIGSSRSTSFFIPIRLLLGDLCLWANRYSEAATYYHDYLTSGTTVTTSYGRIYWDPTTSGFESIYDSYSGSVVSGSSESITSIPMETNKLEGDVSDLRNIFSSTTNNLYYYQATYSNRLFEISSSQSNCKVFQDPDITNAPKDTLFAPSTNTIWETDLVKGDLRLFAIISQGTVSATSNYSTEYQTIYKFSSSVGVQLYRRTQIYLRYAEALNRAGYPTAAFNALKYGMNNNNLKKYADSTEIAKANGSTMLSWPISIYTDATTYGIHARGSGDAYANNFYKIPYKNSKQDTILYVEDLICDEMALETAFEGFRMSDLIRFALRRNDNDYLAKRIASRAGSANINTILYNKLNENRKNWYLPLE
jgi:starch-binding outer membrane protein, SusD/RagB family